MDAVPEDFVLMDILQHPNHGFVGFDRKSPTLNQVWHHQGSDSLLFDALPKQCHRSGDFIRQNLFQQNLPARGPCGVGFVPVMRGCCRHDFPQRPPGGDFG